MFMFTALYPHKILPTVVIKKNIFQSSNSKFIFHIILFIRILNK